MYTKVVIVHGQKLAHDVARLVHASEQMEYLHNI